MACKRNSTGRHILFLLILLGLLFLMSGCTKSSKSEKELVADLQKDSFFLCNLDIAITDYNIIKRQTDVQEKIDIVYINVRAENDSISWDRSYVMTYGLYNEGWILDDVTAYDESNWKVQPLQGVSDEVVQDYMESYKRESAFDSVELINRTTVLEENRGEDKVVFRAIKEHLYGTEILDYNQVWYFDEYSYGFFIAGEPERVNRSIILSNTIVGAEWDNLARYHGTYSAFPDQFDIKVVAMYDDELVLDITKKDIWAAYWEGLNLPPETSAQIVCTMLSYFSDSEEIGFSLSALNGLLYAQTEDDNFDNDDYFIFNLDRAGVGKIESVYGNQSNRVIEKGILSGKSVEEEATEYVVSVAKKYGMISYDPSNPICGVWDWDSDDGDFGDTIWCIWPDGTFDAYINADNGYPLEKERVGELAFQGKWSYDGNNLSLSTGPVGNVEPIMTVELAWYGSDAFELIIAEYPEYFFANRVNYDVEGNDVYFNKPAQNEENNERIDVPNPNGSATIIVMAEEMLPTANGVTKLDVSLPTVYENGDINYVTEVYKANNDAGYVFLIVGDGYGGKRTMKIMTSMDSDGKIIQTKTLEHKETPGVGSKTTSDDFRSQFVGVDISTLDDHVDAITGATHSSKYYFDSIQSAFDAFQLITG